MKTHTIYNIFRQKLLPVLLMMSTFTVANEAFCGHDYEQLICYRNLITLGADDPSFFDFASTSDASLMAENLAGIKGTRLETLKTYPLLRVTTQKPGGIAETLIESAWMDIEDHNVNWVPDCDGDPGNLEGAIPVTREYILGAELNNTVKWRLLREHIYTVFLLKKIKDHVVVHQEDTNMTGPIFKLLAYASQEDKEKEYKEHLKISSTYYQTLEQACELMEEARKETAKHICKYLDTMPTLCPSLVNHIKDQTNTECDLLIANDKKAKFFLERFFEAIAKSDDDPKTLKSKLGKLHQKVKEKIKSSRITGPLTYTSKIQK